MFRSIVTSSLLMLACIAVSSMAFAPSAASRMAFQPATFVKGATPMARQQSMAAATLMILRMAEQETSDESKAKIAADGTFYDDELDSAPIKQGISDTMRARLVNEASRGLDSERPQTNTILYISLGVAVLAVLGGAGVFY